MIDTPQVTQTVRDVFGRKSGRTLPVKIVVGTKEPAENEQGIDKLDSLKKFDGIIKFQ